MDSSFVWILMFAGAAVALLGLFLLASERELKNKRREIEQLLTKLENTAAGTSGGQSFQLQADPSAELSELRAQNHELQNQLTVLSGKLESSRRTVSELQASLQGGAEERPDTQRLHAENEQLNRQVIELRSRLEASAAQIAIGRATPQDLETQDSYVDLQAQMSALRRMLEASQTKVQELETMEHEHRRERHSLQQRIAELEERRLADQEILSEFETMRDRLAQAETAQASMQEEIHRHKDEIPLWQARIAAAEENGQRLAALQRPCDELLAKQTALAEAQHRLQEELAAFTRLIATPPPPSQPFGSLSSSHAPSSGINGAPNSATSDVSPAQTETGQPKQTRTA